MKRRDAAEVIAEFIFVNFDTSLFLFPRQPFVIGDADDGSISHDQSQSVAERNLAAMQKIDRFDNLVREYFILQLVEINSLRSFEITQIGVFGDNRFGRGNFKFGDLARQFL